MLNQFSRTQLLLGAENMDRLAKAKVAIFGIGGVGGYVAEALARSGVGSFVLVDDDKSASRTSTARSSRRERPSDSTRRSHA